jgi:hypothetical protein
MRCWEYGCGDRIYQHLRCNLIGNLIRNWQERVVLNDYAFCPGAHCRKECGFESNSDVAVRLNHAIEVRTGSFGSREFVRQRINFDVLTEHCAFPFRPASV